jgi:hypothetical protein
MQRDALTGQEFEDGAAYGIDTSLTFITYAGGGFTYYCEAAPETARSDAAWRVSRKTDATGDIITAGTGAFDQTADDLAEVAGLTYTLGA